MGSRPLFGLRFFDIAPPAVVGAHLLLLPRLNVPKRPRLTLTLACFGQFKMACRMTGGPHKLDLCGDTGRVDGALCFRVGSL